MHVSSGRALDCPPYCFILDKLSEIGSWNGLSLNELSSILLPNPGRTLEKFLLSTNWQTNMIFNVLHEFFSYINRMSTAQLLIRQSSWTTSTMIYQYSTERSWVTSLASSNLTLTSLCKYDTAASATSFLLKRLLWWRISQPRKILLFVRAQIIVSWMLQCRFQKGRKRFVGFWPVSAHDLDALLLLTVLWFAASSI